MAKVMNITLTSYKCKSIAINTCPWTNDQFDYYNQRCLNFVDVFKPRVDFYTKKIYPPLMSVLGLICHPLIFATLLRPAFRTSTFVYLRIIALVEFLYLILVTIWYYCKNGLEHDGNFCTTACDVIDWGPLSFLKLFSTTLSLFLAFERLVAIIFPKHFSYVSRTKFLIFACFCSMATGFFSLTQMFRYVYVWNFKNNTNEWRVESIRTAFGYSRSYDYYISPIILIIIVSEAILFVAMNSASAAGMWRRQKRVATMISEDSVKRELKQMKRLWRFQSIEAFVMFIDLLCQIAMNIYEHGYTVDVNCDFDEQVRNLAVYETDAWYGFINNGGKYGNHFSIFFLYLIFNPMFRQELKKMVKNIFRIKNTVTNLQP